MRQGARGWMAARVRACALYITAADGRACTSAIRSPGSTRFVTHDRSISGFIGLFSFSPPQALQLEQRLLSSAFYSLGAEYHTALQTTPAPHQRSPATAFAAVQSNGGSGSGTGKRTATGVHVPASASPYHASGAGMGMRARSATAYQLPTSPPHRQSMGIDGRV